MADDLRARLAQIRADAERAVHPSWRDVHPTWTLLGKIDRLAAQNTELLNLLADLVDHEPCDLGDDGYCQAHQWLHSSPCPHGRAKAAFAEGGLFDA